MERKLSLESRSDVEFEIPSPRNFFSSLADGLKGPWGGVSEVPKAQCLEDKPHYPLVEQNNHGALRVNHDQAKEGSLEEEALYPVFKHYVRSSDAADVFLQRQPRTEAVYFHRRYRHVAHCQKLSVTRLCGLWEAQGISTRPPTKSSIMALIDTGTWNVKAWQFLQGGKHLFSPITNQLEAGTTEEKIRILDLAGNPICSWSWHCALEFPQAEFCALGSGNFGHIITSIDTQGPPNHDRICVSNLCKFPFGTGHFHAISTRSLYMALKKSEYDSCLKECWRCLKPGGFLEFTVFDSDIVNAGPTASAMSAEFGSKLEAAGFDSTPTRSWLGRLRRVGFTVEKRSWVFLPLGESFARPGHEREVPPGGDNDPQETTVGSTRLISPITTLVGSLMLEEWIFRSQVEMGSPRDISGRVASISKDRHGAGLKCLFGWATKSSSS